MARMVALVLAAGGAVYLLLATGVAWVICRAITNREQQVPRP